MAPGRASRDEGAVLIHLTEVGQGGRQNRVGPIARGTGVLNRLARPVDNLLEVP